MAMKMEIPGYEELLERLLMALPEEIDKREGSLIMTAAAPVCAELAAAYLTLESYYDLLFPDTSVGEYLDRLAAQYGLKRGEATAARLHAVFTGQQGEKFTPPVGMRFMMNGQFYLLSEAADGEGVLVCEAAGESGNTLGAPLPCDYLSGFGRAEADRLLTPGEEREEDEAFRARLYELLRFPAFGGNVSDYKEKVRSVQGVGGVRVTPVALGGGTVLVEVLGSDLMPAGDALIEEVRLLLIPEYQGDGLGLAPIGHRVTVASPAIDPIGIHAEILTKGDPEAVKAAAEAACKEYLRSLRAGWEDTAPVVRWASMIAAMSEADGVVDVSGLTLNGGSGNISCEGVPVEAEIDLQVSLI